MSDKRTLSEVFSQDAYDQTLDAPGREALARAAGIGNLGGSNYLSNRYYPPQRYYGPNDLELTGDPPERYYPLPSEQTVEGIARMATYPERFNSAFHGYMRRPMSPNVVDRRSDLPLEDTGGRRSLKELM
jgi:hypothetical protein